MCLLNKLFVFVTEDVQLMLFTFVLHKINLLFI